MAEGGDTGKQISSSEEEPLGMRAVLIGATGAIGECLLGELLTSKVCFLLFNQKYVSAALLRIRRG